MNPKTPIEGEKFVQITLINGIVHIGRELTVKSRNSVSLTADEFSANGNRYNIKYLYPDGSCAGLKAPLGFSLTPFIYSRKNDIPDAIKLLKKEFLSVAIETKKELEESIKNLDIAIHNL